MGNYNAHVLTRNRLNKVHTEAPKHLTKLGFNIVRGEGRTKKSYNIKDIYEFKKKKSIELDNKINTLERDFKAILRVSDVIDDILVHKSTKDALRGQNIT